MSSVRHRRSRVNSLSPTLRQFVARLRESETSTGVLASVVAHALLLLILACIVVGGLDDNDSITIIMTELQDVELEEPEPVVPFEPVLEATETQVVLASVADLITLTPELADVAAPEGPPEDDAPPALTDSGPPVTSGESGGGGTPAPRIPQEIENRLKRAQAQTGDVQIALAWNNGNDLDLYVQCPSGQVIWFGQKRSGCRGELDVDMNADGPRSVTPVENVYWKTGKAPLGTFGIGVHEFANYRFRDPTPFQLAVKVDGKVQLYNGMVRQGRSLLPVCQFQRRASDDPVFSKLGQMLRPESPSAGDVAKGERAAQEMLRRGNRFVKRRPKAALSIFRNVQKKFPGTDAATEAAALIEELASKD